MLIRQAILLSLLPDVQQTQLCERIAGCCRALSNVALDLRRWFSRPGRSIRYVDQAGAYHSLQQALVDLESAYKNFGRSGRRP